jgi:hypothetical protein
MSRIARLSSALFQERIMSNMIKTAAKAGMALALTAGLLTAVAMPAQAGDGGAIAAGIIGGTALGVMVGAAAANSAPPPPPPGYYPPPPPPPAYYDPAAAPGPGPYAEPGPQAHCARWRARPDRDGNPVCLRYFRD